MFRESHGSDQFARRVRPTQGTRVTSLILPATSWAASVRAGNIGLRATVLVSEQACYRQIGIQGALSRRARPRIRLTGTTSLSAMKGRGLYESTSKNLPDGLGSGPEPHRVRGHRQGADDRGFHLDAVQL